MNCKKFINEISAFIPRERIYTDESCRLAWGTDANFYRLIPKIVIRSANEQEVSRLLEVADRLSIRLQPGIIGERVNELLKSYGRKFFPDPASVNSAMVGGVIINQSFDTQEDIARYEVLMNDVIHLVVDKYGGSLKAEHGTGRNMAPFVEYEWGTEAFKLMKAIKQLFDTKGILNPGVTFNKDPKCHIKNFKPLPFISKEVDKYIECGFCEINCLTCGFTLSSRQRIVLQREIVCLKVTGEDQRLLHCLQKQFRYAGIKPA